MKGLELLLLGVMVGKLSQQVIELIRFINIELFWKFGFERRKNEHW